MNHRLTTCLVLLCSFPGCGLVTGSARRDPPPDPVQTYEAFGRSLEPLALDRSRTTAAKESDKNKDTGKLGRLDSERRKTWLEEEKEAMMLAKANGPNDIIGTDRTSRLARGIALYKVRQLEGARETYLKLLEEESAYFPARRHLGEVSLSLREWEAARDAFEIVHTQLGSGPRTDSDLGMILLRYFRKQSRRGRELLAKHIADASFGMGNLVMVVEYDFRAQRPERAEPLISDASKFHHDPRDRRHLALMLARAQYRQGKFDKAGPLLIELSRQEWQGQGEALSTLFQVQRALGLFEDAKKTLEKINGPGFETARSESSYSKVEIERLTNQIDEEIQLGRRVAAISIPEIVIDLIYEPRAEKRRETLLQISRQRQLKTKALFYELCLSREKEASIRRLAYLLLARAYPRNRAFLELGVKDSDPDVRKVAITKLEQLPNQEARLSLFRALEREDDSALFTKIHAALCKCCNDIIMLEPGEASGKTERDKRRLFWAKKLDILRSDAKEGSFIDRSHSQE